MTFLVLGVISQSKRTIKLLAIESSHNKSQSAITNITPRSITISKGAPPIQYVHVRYGALLLFIVRLSHIFEHML